MLRRNKNAWRGLQSIAESRDPGAVGGQQKYKQGAAIGVAQAATGVGMRSREDRSCLVLPDFGLYEGHASASQMRAKVRGLPFKMLKNKG